MSDQKYINYYVEHAVGTAQEYLVNILQLKTQLRIANDIVAEKDNFISNLQNELAQNINDNTEKSHTINHLKSIENEYHALQNKVSHMDTLLNQINDMKRIIKERESEIESLRAPVINTKKKPVKPETTVLPRKPNEDF